MGCMRKESGDAVQKCLLSLETGLQLMAGQQTMSGQKCVLPSQILRLPDNLSGRLL